jgi:protoporphyrinogen oxidase
MSRAPIAVLGTGMAGTGAAYALQQSGAPFVCYDKNGYRGGHTYSKRYSSGFVFDEGPHVSFTKNSRIRDLLAQSVGGQYQEQKFVLDNYWRGYRIPHPVQCHLSELPVDLRVKVICDFVARRPRSDQTTAAEAPQTYAQWLYAVYGKTFAETFPMVYGKKYHTATMDQLTTEWIGPRMYQPSLEDLLSGAFERRIPDKHYIQAIRYPSEGGFVSYLEGISQEFHVRLNHQVVGIDPRAKVLRFSNGQSHPYSAVISSIPLPELIPMIDGVPQAVVAASRALAYSNVLLFNVGLDRSDISDAATTYFYDEDVIFARVSVPHMFAPGNVPPGCGSIQAEVYFSDKYRPLTVEPQSLMPTVLQDLRRCGFIREQDTILMTDIMVSRYGNVIYDMERHAAVSLVHEFLDSVSIRYCGRFGKWDHSWTDEAFVSGEESAAALLGATTTA